MDILSSNCWDLLLKFNTNKEQNCINRRQEKEKYIQNITFIVFVIHVDKDNINTSIIKKKISFANNKKMNKIKQQSFFIYLI